MHHLFTDVRNWEHWRVFQEMAWCCDIVLIDHDSVVCFRWHEGNAGEWLGVLADRVWRLKQDETHVYFKVTHIFFYQVEIHCKVCVFTSG